MLAQDVKDLEIENSNLKKELYQLKQSISTRSSKPRSCEYCKHYLQHYVKVKTKYQETHCGHCTHGQCKKRKPDDSCMYFEIGAYGID